MKKALIMALCLVLVAALSVAGTLAYLQFQTETDVNVMTIGNVKIEQLEYERAVDENGNYITVDTSNVNPNYGFNTTWKLQPFTQGKPAIPAVYSNGTGEYSFDEQNHQLYNEVGAPGSNALFSGVGNVIDKFVFVKNTGKTSAYYRTIIAIEWPYQPEWESIVPEKQLVHKSLNGNSRFTSNDIGFTYIDGTRYKLREMVYNQELAPGEVSRPSLLQLFLDPKVTNEICTAFGETWDIFVVSQAVQASGFDDADTALDAAFGDITTTQHPWSDTAPVIPVVVENDADLADAIADGAMIYLKDGNYNLSAGTAIPAGTSLIAIGDNANIAIPAPTAKNTSAVTLGDNVTLKGFKIADNGQGVGNGEAGLVLANGKNVVVEDCEFDISGTNAIALAVGGNANGLTVKNCDFIGGYKHIGPAPGNPKGVVIDGCTFTGANSSYAIHLNATSHDTVIKNSTIALFNTFFGFGGDAGKLVFDNCDFVVESGKTNVVKLYRDADFINCDFEEGFLFSDANKDTKVTFEGGSWGSGTIKEHFLADSFTYNMDATFDGDAWYWNTTTDKWEDK